MHIYSWASNPNQYLQICKVFEVYNKVAYTCFFLSRIHIFPKIHKKYSKLSIESKSVNATTNDNISKYFPILGIYSLIAPFIPPLSSIPCLYLEYWSWSSKEISKLIVLMKIPNPSAKMRYRSFPCLINVFPWVKGTFWLRSGQTSSTIYCMPITYYHTWYNIVETL